MVAIKDGQRSADIGNNSPGPFPEKFGLDRIDVEAAFLQRDDRPHGEIGHQQESDDLPTRFVLLLSLGVQQTLRRVQDEDSLRNSLQNGCQRRHEYEQGV